MKARTLTSGVLAGLAATALLASAALATSTVDATTDNGAPAVPGTAISTLAKAGSEVGEAKGDAISAAAKAGAADEGSSSSDKNAFGASISALARATAPGADHGTTVSAAASAFGRAIATLAQTTTETGQAKGDAIRTAARKGPSAP